MRVFKVSYSLAMPANAEKFKSQRGELKGKKCVKFLDGKGHAKIARLTKSGDKILVETAHWHVGFEDNLGISRQLKAYTNKQASVDLADRISDLKSCRANNRPLGDSLQKFVEQMPSRVRDELIAFGLIDGRSMAAGRRLTEYIEEFEDYLTKKERGPRHIREVTETLRKIFRECGFVVWSDIAAEPLMNYLDGRRDEGRGVSKRRYNGLLGMVKQFCRWAVKQRMVVSSPIDYLDGLDNPQTDQRHHRRALGLNDFRRFLEGAMAGPRKFGLTGPERNFIYRFAAETALRNIDLRRLRVQDCDFAERKIMIEAGRTKNKQRSFVYLKPATALELKQYCKNKMPHATIFYLPDKCSRMVQFDLAGTRIVDDSGNEVLPAIPYCDGNGDYFDFHSLRHQSASLFGMNADTPEPVRQQLMRHKNAAMTRLYTHAAEDQQRAAVDALPDLAQPSREAQAKVKTGTDNDILSESCFHSAQIRANMDNGGSKSLDIDSKAAFCVGNEVAEQILIPVQSKPPMYRRLMFTSGQGRLTIQNTLMVS